MDFNEKNHKAIVSYYEPDRPDESFEGFDYMATQKDFLVFAWESGSMIEMIPIIDISRISQKEMGGISSGH